MKPWRWFKRLGPMQRNDIRSSCMNLYYEATRALKHCEMCPGFDSRHGRRAQDLLKKMDGHLGKIMRSIND